MPQVLGSFLVQGGAGVPVITLENVRKQYGSFVAVDDANFSIGRGEFFAMLGPSGCGKTTTLKMIAGFEQPTSGKVILEGEDVSAVPPYKRNVNTVFQQYALFPHMSVFDNVAFGPRSKKLDENIVKTRVMEMLEVVRLSDFAQRRPAQLSGGQQQRVALARALVNYPSALLLDEPLAALDLKLREAMQLELKRIQREVGITFVFVTHDQGEALTMSDRIAVMSEGRIEMIGTPEEIYEEPASVFVAGFIGSANLLPGTVTSLTATGVTVKLNCGATVESSPANVAVGDSVTVMVRPERITPGAASTAGRSISVAVTDLVFQGPSVRLIAKLNDGTEVASVIGSNNKFDLPRPGDRIELSWDHSGAFTLAGHPEMAGSTTSNLDHVEANL